MKIGYIDYSPATSSLDIFVTGCLSPFCMGCCNPELANFDEGTDWTYFKGKINNYIKSYGSLIKNIFLVGGSPNHQLVEDLTEFIKFIRPFNRDIWLYCREDLEHVQKIFLENCKYIKSGEYIPKLRTKNNIVTVSNGTTVKLATSNQVIYEKGVDY